MFFGGEAASLLCSHGWIAAGYSRLYPFGFCEKNYHLICVSSQTAKHSRSESLSISASD
jgi:hypothetical protein